MRDPLIEILAEFSAAFQGRLREMPALEEFALAPFQARLLRLIGSRPGSRQQDLAALLGRDKAQVARTFGELERRGLVRRDAHETDWRSRNLSVTPEGQAACDVIDKERERLGAAATAGLSAAERAALTEGLQKMLFALRES